MFAVHVVCTILPVLERQGAELAKILISTALHIPKMVLGHVKLAIRCLHERHRAKLANAITV
jgi:hypothetical protein